MIRRRSTPWIHYWSRPLLGAIAALGMLNTGYLTYEKLTGGTPICTAGEQVKGCVDVLSSPWGTVFNQPLALFGLLAYTSMLLLAVFPIVLISKDNDSKKSSQNKSTRQLENLSWWLLWIGAIAMTVFSGYLMYVLAFKLQAVCWYCIASAVFALSMLTLTVLGREWEDIGQVLFIGLIVVVVTLIGTLGIYSGIDTSKNENIDTIASSEQRINFSPREEPNPNFGWEITTTSGESEIALAQHLVKIGAKEYVAYWCPHCHEQKLLFGKEAYQIINNNNITVECAADSPKGKPELCRAAKIQGFPSWIINGKIYSGVQNLSDLARLSGYTGPQNFKYFR
ncbi:vitamin K epoxide reductase family protein [Cylindrospermopsis raciborskii]|uniref:vitamin K epoxide reductase family protein n=1 Tax=Cylindrospermopsis raciborskii TaxID=77022 RepID=UPI003DA35077